MIQYLIRIDINFNYITKQYIKQIQKLVVIALNQDGVQNGRRKSAFSSLNIGCAISFIQYRENMIYKGFYIPICLSTYAYCESTCCSEHSRGTAR